MSTSYSWEIGSQLSTKDGRKCGNAVIVERVKSMLTPIWSGWIVVTDAGNGMTLTEPELNELFHPPAQKMDPQTAPGYVKWMLNRNRTRQDERV